MTTLMIFVCGAGAGAGGLLISVVLVMVCGRKNAERNRECGIAASERDRRWHCAQPCADRGRH